MLIELTNRCNLSCHHCLDRRHSGDGDLKIEIFERILQNARKHGFDYISFTGGEPTLHPGFTEMLTMVSEAGYNFGFVTNGWNFTRIYEKLLPHSNKLTGITFSLDGAREETHDRLRGRDSYRRMMQAVSICVVKDVPFTFNTVITSYNRGELKEMAGLAAKLGSRGLRFGHLISHPRTETEYLGLSPAERKETEAIIWQLQNTLHMPIVMASGYYTTDLFPCAPLKMQEISVNWRGNITACCNLSGHGEDVGNDDIIGNLHEMRFSEAYGRLVQANRKFQKDKHTLYNNGKFKDSDYFPCWYCLNYFRKVDWLSYYPENPWSSLVWTK
ncbi:MAG: radical SAM domain protein [Candidatus Jettenia ecosi]|uniref:Radical SAM domain protein n=1 Tax=Candidatus Jettenia ecosi TaxID=2494326 RepID=A0A533QBD1_9BACT|nr:MAG: radical SAM domain protein [Candidatus Jettenia ecosi]